MTSKLPIGDLAPGTSEFENQVITEQVEDNYHNKRDLTSKLPIDDQSPRTSGASSESKNQVSKEQVESNNQDERNLNRITKSDLNSFPNLTPNVLIDNQATGKAGASSEPENQVLNEQVESNDQDEPNLNRITTSDLNSFPNLTPNLLIDDQAPSTSGDVSDFENPVINEKVKDNNPQQDKSNLIRITKADVNKFPNFDPTKVPDTIENTGYFIQEFIEIQRKKKKRSTRSKRKLGHEVVLEPLGLDPKVIDCLQKNGDDFKLMVYHSKSMSICKGQEFTKTLVNEAEGDNIVTNKLSSSFIYFFYRVSGESKLPEIFIITIGQTWRIANDVALGSFSNSIKEKDLEREAVYQYRINTGGGNVFSIASQARAGEKLDSSTISPESLERKSTRFPKGDSSINKQSGFKRGSKVHIGNTNLSFDLKLNIEVIHGFIKYIAETSKNYQSKEEGKLQTVEDKVLVKQLNKELLNKLTEKDAEGHFCTSKQFQHEEALQWNTATKLRLLFPGNKITSKSYDIPVSFSVVVGDLIKRKIPKKKWLQMEVVWLRNKEPLKYFLEDYVTLNGKFYRYLFGEWLIVTYEYIAEIDVQFKEVLKKSFLRASVDFPILPWIYKSSEAPTTKKPKPSGLKRAKEICQSESPKAKKAKEIKITDGKHGSVSETSQFQAPSKSINEHVVGSQASMPPVSSSRDVWSDQQKSTDYSSKEPDSMHDSAIGMSQTQHSSTNCSLSDTVSQVVSQSRLSENQNMQQNYQDTNTSQSEVESHTLTLLKKASVLSLPEVEPPLASGSQTTSDIVQVNIGEVCKHADVVRGKKCLTGFETERIKIKKDIETIHFPVKADFDQILREGTKVEDGKEIKVSYSAYVSQKKNESSYVESKGTKEELEELLFLRLCTAMSEGEYNDSHMLLREILKYHENDRFIIIPGDELFVRHSNTELYDILISDEKEKLTYVVQVKAGFGNTTRDACSQIRLSAQKIRQSIVCDSSRSALLQYWKENTKARLSNSSTGYKADVGKILYDIGIEKFLSLFRDENRRLVFVFGCRDDRKNTNGEPEDLEIEYERALKTDKNISAENEIREELRGKCSLSQEEIQKVIDILQEFQILNSYGEITNVYVLQTDAETTAILKKIRIKYGSKGDVIKVVKDILRQRKAVTKSDIAKCSLIDLEKQFREFHAGKKQFELKICQIPMKFYLKPNQR